MKKAKSPAVGNLYDVIEEANLPCVKEEIDKFFSVKDNCFHLYRLEKINGIKIHRWLKYWAPDSIVSKLSTLDPKTKILVFCDPIPENKEEARRVYQTYGAVHPIRGVAILDSKGHLLEKLADDASRYIWMSK